MVPIRDESWQVFQLGLQKSMVEEQGQGAGSKWYERTCILAMVVSRVLDDSCSEI